MSSRFIPDLVGYKFLALPLCDYIPLGGINPGSQILAHKIGINMNISVSCGRL